MLCYLPGGIVIFTKKNCTTLNSSNELPLGTAVPSASLPHQLLLFPGFINSVERLPEGQSLGWAKNDITMVKIPVL